MPRSHKLLLVLSIALLALALGTLLAPLIMARSIAAWLQFEASRSGLTVTAGSIRAPFLHPVEIDDLRITRPGRDGMHLHVAIPRLSAGLRLLALVRHSQRESPLRSLRIEHARIQIHGRARDPSQRLDWETLGRMLPRDFDISSDEIVFDQPLMRFTVRDAQLSARDSDSGVFAIASLVLRAGHLHNTLADLRGITRWEDERLTVGSLHLLEGVVLDAAALDLSKLRSSRVSAELSGAVLGGTLRANFAADRSGKNSVWEAAASGAGISLDQLPRAFGWNETVHGSLRASKFTFRGDPRDLLHATASAWLEVAGFQWRDRQADEVMLGAVFYERAVQLQELYIKQRHNELTVSGESTLGADWLNPDFRGDIAGSIDDLGEFAELFGAPSKSFAGKIAARGRVHAHERHLDGELAITGDALKILQQPVDSLTARLTLDSPRLQLEQIELSRGEDFLRGTAQIDFARSRSFTVTADCWLRELQGYDIRVPLLGVTRGTFFGKLDASGDQSASSLSLEAQLDDMKLVTGATMRGHSATINVLNLTMNGLTAAFIGDVSLANRKHVTLTLVPAAVMRFVAQPDPSHCLRGIELAAGQDGAAVSRIAITQDEATVRLDGGTEIVPVCRGEETPAQPLRLLVLPQNSPTLPSNP